MKIPPISLDGSTSSAPTGPGSGKLALGLGNIPKLLNLPAHAFVEDEKDNPPPPPASGLILPLHKISDDRVRGVSKRLVCGYAEMIGRRKTMEDRLTIFGNFRNRDEEDYFAVFDGHSGDETASYCAAQLHTKLLQQMDLSMDPREFFKIAFEQCNASLERAKKRGGTTAVIAFFKGPELYVANTGDSRAVLCRNRKAHRVTTDHKPDLPQERERIIRMGGMVMNGGITGTLTVSRALGDFSYKPFITCEPDVFGPFLLEEGCELLILACDGLWDVVTDEEAVEFALACRNPEEAAVKLRDTAYSRESRDNISVLVIYCPNFAGNPSGDGSLTARGGSGADTARGEKGGGGGESSRRMESSRGNESAREVESSSCSASSDS